MCTLLACLYVLDLWGGRLAGFHRHIWFTVARESTALVGFNLIFIYLPPLCAIGTGLTFARRSPRPQFCFSRLFCFWKQVTFKKLSFHSYTQKVHPYCTYTSSAKIHSVISVCFTNTLTHIHTHSHKHSLTHSHTHTHTHTHTLSLQIAVSENCWHARTNECLYKYNFYQRK